ncbi:MAG: cyclic nucleotide-binding domain-containing protein [Desulfotignum sp.]|nr:cyclic nucleotide-binding domain-containing protein [Desulfotignum sp.]MCF8126445.1 cyclic nucleotide-binding domain-containing protein [Desulfotignum sp.]
MTRDERIRLLPRGGIIVSTSQGTVQFGIPPETIKDTMKEGVPGIFILPWSLFSLEKGVSLAELEFPVYYHFFFLKKKIEVVCTREQKQRLKTVLTEALFGPSTLAHEAEFSQGTATPGFPDLKAEMNHFRTMPVNGRTKYLTLADVVRFHVFDQTGTVCIKDLTIQVDKNLTYTIQQGTFTLAAIPVNQPLIPENPIDFSIQHVFSPPVFGVTTLGSGHGFDPDAMTSGMIIWVNQRGIMVDPPVHSSVDLIRLGVNPKILDGIILTHCHADHDSGTLQKIMLEGKITLYTTPTIFNSFIRKSAALIDIKKSRLKKAFSFVPLPIGEPINIHGGMFEFSYSFHSIPTISFMVTHAGKTLVYSSDTHNDPAYIHAMHKKGIMDKSRRDFLVQFPWDKDLILHEAGVPPLHTPIDYLVSLPEQVRDRIYLVHVAQDQVPVDSRLKIAPTGLSSTVVLFSSPGQFREAIDILGAFLDLHLFRELPPEKTMEFLCIAVPETLEPGTVLFRKGDFGDRFYLIISGQVDIMEEGNLLTTFSRSDFFGEKCLFSDQPRTADATTRSRVRLVGIDRQDMRTFIRNTDLEKTLAHLSIFQGRALRNILDANPVFLNLTPSQKIQLFQIVESVTLKKNSDTILIREKEKPEACYFIHSGTVTAYRSRRQVDVLTPGSLFGINPVLHTLSGSDYTFSAGPDTVLYRFQARAIKAFAEKNPGVFLKLCHHPF